jgi:antitoxin component YwqK of YwqJK toxin-antitoxin module
MRPYTFWFVTAFAFYSCGSVPEQKKSGGGNDTLHPKNYTALPFNATDSLKDTSSFSETFYPIPNIQDSVLICMNEPMPYYISCEDSPCAQKIVYPDGKLKASGNCTNGKRSGVWAAWYPNGKLMSRGGLKNGFPQGKWEFYFEGGQKKAEGAFKKGQFELGCAGSGNFITVSTMNGIWNFWFGNGQPMLTCAFDQDNNKLERQEGPFTTWYSNGKTKSDGFYRNGERTGPWKWWYANGNIAEEGEYEYRDCGLYDYISFECPAGTWTYWNEDGTIRKKELYENGIVKKKITY